MLRTSAWILIFSLLGQSATAASPRSLFEREKMNVQQLSEFIYGDEVEQKLMPVYLLGAVQRPGLYHLPVNTDLTTLLSIAGGPNENSEVDDITIRNDSSKRLDKVDFGAITRTRDARAPVLRGSDLVYVPMKEPAVSNNTLLVMTVVGGLLTVVMTGLLIKREL